MFLDAILARNPSLVDTAIALHREAIIPPNSFVIDLDTVEENSALLGEAAQKHGLALYFTTKQLGFNPRVASCVSRTGIPKAIAIDFREAAILSQHHVPIGHIGHIVQTPLQLIPRMLTLEPEVITVFSVEKARQISQAAVQSQQEARLLLRVISDNDFFYPGQEGGIHLKNLVPMATAILKLPNVRITGVTSFPCLQLDEGAHELRPTENFRTILQAAHVLQEKLGVEIEQINAPGNSCVHAFPLLAKMGATHGEPGHALTGTTYLHTRPGEPEKPALVLISEISHINGERAYFFGGGAHRRAKIHQALVGSNLERMTKTPVYEIDPTVIDYYNALVLPRHNQIEVGDSVVLASRAQIFVSRANVAVVQGIQKGQPVFLGLYDAWGRAVERSS